MAEKALTFLRAHLVLVSRIVRHESTDVEADGIEMTSDQPEVARMLAAVDVVLQRGTVPTVELLSRAIREWERADELAKDRIATLKNYLAAVRRLEQLEIPWEAAKQRSARPSPDSVDVAFVDAMSSQITELRDALGEEQHEIERVLNDVGRSLETYSLARGANGIGGFVAGEIAAAVGAYREWPISRSRTKTAAGATPATRVAASTMPLSVDETVTKVSRAVERALRPAFTEAPTREVQVQDVIETILKAIEVRHVRDREIAPVGPTVFKPDFTFGDDLALEVKLATGKHGEREIQRELAEDGRHAEGVVVHALDRMILAEPGPDRIERRKVHARATCPRRAPPRPTADGTQSKHEHSGNDVTGADQASDFRSRPDTERAGN